MLMRNVALFRGREDRTADAAADYIDGDIRPMQRVDCCLGAGNQFANVTFAEPRDCAASWPNNVEPCGIDGVKRNNSIHGRRSQRSDLALYSSARCEFVDTFETA